MHGQSNPVTVRPKAFVCGCSISGVAGSNFAKGMDVRLSCSLCGVQVAASTMGWTLVQRSPTQCVCVCCVCVVCVWFHTLQNPHTHNHTFQNTHTQNHTLQNPHIHTPTHYKTHTLQNKLKQPQYKRRTKWNSHNTIKYPQYKVTIMYMVLLSPRT